MNHWKNEQVPRENGKDMKYSQNPAHYSNSRPLKSEEPIECDDDYGDQDEDALYSNDDEELDQSFDDSDLQNKDPGMLQLL